MPHTLRVLGVVPARGGSKGVPRKNARRLRGKPLIQYTAEAALEARRLTRVMLTTDNEEIARIGRKCGLEVPFIRPRELAQDSTPMLPVVQHAVQWYEQRGEVFHSVCLLQPTQPFRRASDIDACIELLEENDFDSVITILRIPPEHHPYWAYFRGPDGGLKLFTGEDSPVPRRQDLPPAFHREGSVYVTRRDVLMDQNSLYGARVGGYLMDVGLYVNIDSLEDWRKAEQMLQAAAG